MKSKHGRLRLLRRRVASDMRRLQIKIHAEPIEDSRLLWLGQWSYADEVARWIDETIKASRP